MKISILFNLLFVLFSCKEPVIRLPKPKELISEDRMVKIMLEMVSTESYLKNEFTSMPIFSELMKKCGKDILDKNKVNTQDFTNSVDYYSSHVAPLQKIYATTLDSLSLRLAKIKR